MMPRTPSPILTTLAALSTLVAASVRLAASPTTPVNVGVVVSPECVISAAPLAFGGYDPVGAHATGDLDGSATISVACTKGMVATVALERGLNGDSAARRMAAGGERLEYELFRDSARTDVWGDGLIERALTLGVSTSKAPQQLVVYGRVPAGQDVRAGTYVDSVLATVNF